MAKNEGSRLAQSRKCLFPTSVPKIRDTSSKTNTTSFLRGQSYTFGQFDVGSLDVGKWQNIGTSLHTGAFRSEGICGNGYFAREIIPNISAFPHHLPVNEFKKRRNALNLDQAGDLVKFPKEIRDMIYEDCCLPSNSDEGSSQTAHVSMLLNLRATCSFIHEEVGAFLYNHHVFYLSTPARLANFTRCLSFSVIPPPLVLGTVILEIGIFPLLDGVEDAQQRVTFTTGDGHEHEVVERNYSFSEPYENVKNLCFTNPHFLEMSNKDWEGTRTWSENTFREDWAAAIKGLLKYKVKKLIIRAYADDDWVWRPSGELMNSLDSIGRSKKVAKVVIDFGDETIDQLLENIATEMKALKRQYGWD